MGDERIRRKEDKLLARYRSHRGVFVGAIFLCLVSLFSWFVMRSTGSDDTPALETASFCTAVFWAAIAVYAHSQLNHIATIKRYRAMLQETSAPPSE